MYEKNMKKVVFLLIAIFLVPLVSADYSLEATASKRTINLGERISVTGRVLEDAYAFSEGYVLVEFKRNDTVVYRFPSLLSNGNFRTDITFERDDTGDYLQPGEYRVSVTLQDFYGNELKVFDNVISILLSKDLLISADLSKTQINPGEPLSVSGNVEKYYGGILPSGTIQIDSEDANYDAVIENGLFSLTFDTRNDAKSGKHEVKLSIQDDHGNSGLQSLYYLVNAVPTTIIGNMEQDSYAPKEILTLKPQLYDQAGDQLERELDILIKRPTGEIEFNKKVIANRAFTYELPELSLPGLWSIVVSYGSLNDEQVFEVKEVKDISIELDGQTLLVSNIGNVFYDDDLEVSLKGGKGEYQISKKTGLSPGQTIPIELYKDVEDGVYEISANGFVFPNVNVVDTRKINEKGSDFFRGVTGNFVGSSGSDTSKKPLLILLLMIVALLGIYFVYMTNYNRKMKRGREREMAVAQKKVVEIKKEKTVNPRPKYSFGVANQSDIEDYKKKVLEDIKKQQEERPRPSYGYDRPLERKGREGGSKGMFGM